MNEITTAAAVVVAVCATITVILKVLSYFHVESAEVVRFFSKQGRNLAWNIYLLIASILSVTVAYVMISLPLLLPFTIAIATVEVLMLWSLLNIWSPAIQQLRNTKLDYAFDVTSFCLILLILVGYWIKQWPDWQTPTILSSLLAIALGFYIIDKFILRRKRKMGHSRRR